MGPSARARRAVHAGADLLGAAAVAAPIAVAAAAGAAFRKRSSTVVPYAQLLGRQAREYALDIMDPERLDSHERQEYEKLLG